MPERRKTNGERRRESRFHLPPTEPPQPLDRFISLPQTPSLSLSIFVKYLPLPLSLSQSYLSHSERILSHLILLLLGFALFLIFLVSAKKHFLNQSKLIRSRRLKKFSESKSSPPSSFLSFSLAPTCCRLLRRSLKPAQKLSQIFSTKQPKNQKTEINLESKKRIWRQKHSSVLFKGKSFSSSSSRSGQKPIIAIIAIF